MGQKEEVTDIQHSIFSCLLDTRQKSPTRPRPWKNAELAHSTWNDLLRRVFSQLVLIP